MIVHNVRRSAIRFLTALLTNCTKQLQDIILGRGPNGVSRLVDLLQDEREVIRNDVIKIKSLNKISTNLRCFEGSSFITNFNAFER